MNRQRSLTFGAINITLPPPHAAKTYLDLFMAAQQEGATVSLQGDWVGLIGLATPEDDPEAGLVIRGEFYKYVDLDAARDWYNVLSRKPAEPSELRRLSIPEELKPHFQFLPFVFFAKGHRLIAVTRDGKDAMSIRQMETVLNNAMNTEAIQAKFGRVEVTVEPSLETLDEILTMPHLHRLELEIKRPNPDDFEEFEQDFLDELEKQRASGIGMQISAQSGETLRPSQRTTWLAQIAKSNGKVVGTGGLRGKTRTLSTAKHPFEQRESYMPWLETRSDAVLTKAKAIVGKFVRRP